MPPRHSPSPTWFRLAIIAMAVVVLCSCRTSAPTYRVAEATDENKLASAFEQLPEHEPRAEAMAIDDEVHVDDQMQLAAAELEIPAQASDQDLQFEEPPYQEPQYQEPAYPGLVPQFDPQACPTAPCGPGGGCLACNEDGARGPSDEYLCDGGDAGPAAAVIKTGAAIGVEPQDAVAHYDTIDGRTVITPSNKVCIYAPRFAAIREVVDLRAVARIDAPHGEIATLGPQKINENELAASSLAALKPNIDRAKTPPSLLRERQQAGELDRDRRVAVTLGTLAPYCNIQVVRTGEFVGRDVVKIARASLAAITWTGNQAAQVLLDSRKAQAEVNVQTPGTIYLLVEPNHPKLRLIKLASTSQAQPGEEVEFTLRFDNVGDRVIGNVTIIDSLTTRLEYVDGTQKSSLKANFSSHANDGDSLILRWEIDEPLQPGEGGAIQFRTKVR
jgi:uncharacterized repeat protein (TIGR01451 family)